MSVNIGQNGWRNAMIFRVCVRELPPPPPLLICYWLGLGGVSHLMGLGGAVIMECRTCGMLDLWGVGLVGCRTCETTSYLLTKSTCFLNMFNCRQKNAFIVSVFK